jgi:hypothetical protein
MPKSAPEMFEYPNFRQAAIKPSAAKSDVEDGCRFVGRQQVRILGNG